MPINNAMIRIRRQSCFKVIREIMGPQVTGLVRGHASSGAYSSSVEEIITKRKNAAAS